jgi:hypothetical protein
MSVRIVEDDYMEKFHQGEVNMAVWDLQGQGCSVTDIRRVKKMTLFWGKNRTEIYYTRPEKKKE